MVSDMACKIILEWKDGGTGSWWHATLGEANDSVEFSLSYHPTCCRRGPFRLLIEVAGGEFHESWGCLDGQDQPLRYFHIKECALQEAQAIADVLLADRLKVGIPAWFPGRTDG